MSETASIQLSENAAVIYEEFFVPALFAQWAPQVANAAGIARGESVLDVGCGTGVLAREAAARVGPAGIVTGLDLNETMLAVAHEHAPDIAWRQGDVARLPFDDASFDVVTSQFMLMFVADKVGALKEMWRVVRPGGRLCIAVWKDSAGYAALADIARRRLGEEVASTLTVPFSLGDPAHLSSLFEAAGTPTPEIDSRDGWAKFASIDEFVRIEVKGWVLAETLDENGYAALLEEARTKLTSFRNDAGRVAIPANAHIVTATKR